jgi:hypothetical protein
MVLAGAVRDFAYGKSTHLLLTYNRVSLYHDLLFVRLCPPNILYIYLQFHRDIVESSKINRMYTFT